MEKIEKQQEIIKQLRNELKATKQKVRDLEQSRDLHKQKGKQLKSEVSELKKNL
jgi:hypothetical protein